MYSIQHYVTKFVSDLRQVSCFLRVLWFPPQIKLTGTIIPLTLTTCIIISALHVPILIYYSYIFSSANRTAIENYLNTTVNWALLDTQDQLLDQMETFAIYYISKYIALYSLIMFYMIYHLYLLDIPWVKII